MLNDMQNINKSIIINHNPMNGSIKSSRTT